MTASASSASAGQSPSLVVSSIAGWENLAALETELAMLAAAALEPNPSAEAWMLVPALRYLAAGTPLHVLAIREAPASGAAEMPLRGVFVLEVRMRGGRVPIRTLRLWDHLYSLSPAPLVHRDHARDCLRALFRWTADAMPRGTLLEFPNLRTESAFYAEITGFLRQDAIAHRLDHVFQRAFFRPGPDVETFMQDVGTKHSQREWRRLERRLAENGAMRYELLDASADASAWVAEFIDLEMRGWKGRQGSAFGCDPAHAAFLAEVVGAAHARHKAMLIALRLDGKPLAMKLNIVCPPGGYTFKIAFDEAYGKFTPGTLLELENIRLLHQRDDIRWMDSLAAPDHPLIDRLWRERTEVATVLAAPPRLSAKLIVMALPLLRRLRERWRAGGSAARSGGA